MPGSDGYFDLSQKIHVFSDRTPMEFVHRRNYESSTNYRLHLNNYIEVYVYISGEADYIVADEYYHLRQGDIVVINPHDVHAVVLKEPCDYERFYILIPVDTFSGYTYNPLAKILNRPADASAVISLDAEKWQSAKQMLYEASRLCAAVTDSRAQMQIYALLMQFMCLVDSQALERKADHAEINPDALPQKVKDILEYIHEDLPTITSVNMIADRFGITVPYLSALFKKHIGVPLNMYLRLTRIGLAKRLLEEGASVTYACYESGFSDCSYFIKCFRQCEHITPYQYRNKLLGKN